MESTKKRNIYKGEKLLTCGGGSGAESQVKLLASDLSSRIAYIQRLLVIDCSPLFFFSVTLSLCFYPFGSHSKQEHQSSILPS